MLYELPTICPICKKTFHVRRLGCENCGSTLEGAFELDKLSQLSSEMRQFVIIFLKSRGNIREMEKFYGISYPTVRSRLDEIIAALDGQGITSGTRDVFRNKKDEGQDDFENDGEGQDDSEYDGEGQDDTEYGGEDEFPGNTNFEPGGDENESGANGGEPGGDYKNAAAETEKLSRLAILKMLANGEIETEKARELLNETKGKK